MPSTAYVTFEKNCGDVDRLLEIHTDLTGEAPGRRWQVEALHKSAIVLLTAFWEALCEDLAPEGRRHLVRRTKSAKGLPEQLRKQVAKELETSKHELAVWELADRGRRQMLTSRLDRLQEERNRRLNAPKTVYIDRLFYEALGINDISKAWYWPGMRAQRAAAKLDEYVTLRGRDSAPRDGGEQRHQSRRQQLLQPPPSPRRPDRAPDRWVDQAGRWSFTVGLRFRTRQVSVSRCSAPS